MNPGIVLLQVALATYTPKAVVPFSQQSGESLFALETCIVAASGVARGEAATTLMRLGLLRQPDGDAQASSMLRRVAIATSTWPLDERQALLSELLLQNTFDNVLNKLVLEHIGPPPEFVSSNRRTRWLAGMLRRAYTNLPIDQLWEQEQGAWQAAQPSAAQVQRAQVRVAAYLGPVDGTVLPNFRVLMNPLMNVFNGICARGAAGEIWLLCGPTHSPEDAEVLMIHEYLHLTLRNAMASLAIKRALRASQAYYDELRQNGTDVLGYDDWPQYAEEGLVRVLSYRILGLPPSTTEIRSESLFVPALRRYELGFVGFREAVVNALLETHQNR